MRAGGGFGKDQFVGVACALKGIPFTGPFAIDRLPIVRVTAPVRACACLCVRVCDICKRTTTGMACEQDISSGIGCRTVCVRACALTNANANNYMCGTCAAEHLACTRIGSTIATRMQAHIRTIMLNSI